MKRYHLTTLCIALAMALGACSEGLSLQEPTTGEILILDPSSAKSIKGFAADGASTLEIKVTLNAEENPTYISITPEDDAYGLFSSSTSTAASSSLTYALTAEDLARGYALLYLQADETTPSALATSSTATINYRIEITTESDTIEKTLSVDVIRPPVIFAHGFGSDKSTYDPMLSYITPKGLYVDGALYALDYATTSLSSYDVNIDVIPDAIDYTKSVMLTSGYVFEKAVIVGHSMGGVLTRLYMQGNYGATYRDDILKIITIDSPFLGTQLANFGVSLADAYPDSPLKIIKKIGAIIDFQVDSEATVTELNGTLLNSVILPTHILSATFGDTKSIATLIKEEQYIQAFLTFLIQHIATELIYNEDNDLIVPLSSQICGIENGVLKNFVTTYSGEWHCSVHTTQTTSDEVLKLLETPSTDSNSYSTAGFKPSFLSYNSSNHTSLTMVEKSATQIESLADIILKIGLDTDGNIVNMSYQSANETQRSIDDDSVAEQHTIGIISSDSSQILYSIE